MSGPVFMGIREYARWRTTQYQPISHVAVQNAIRNGRIRKDPTTGKIDRDQADADWASNTDLSIQDNAVTGNTRHRPHEDGTPRVMAIDGLERRGATDEEAAPSPKEAAENQARGWAAARGARETIEAARARLKLDTERGDLVKATDVDLAAFRAARATRDRLIALPDRLVPILIGITNADEMRKVLERDIEEVCSELTTAFR